MSVGVAGVVGVVAGGVSGVGVTGVVGGVTDGVTVVGVGAGGSATRTAPAPTAYPGPDARATDATIPAATHASRLLRGRC
ncbi:hypothetical protein [Streptomyces sp. NBC_00620]|uniref:hypothetical protein n=1 Tax=Streptomyces sp. NBC_00620 TaxID=2903666 RepID=UPI0022519DE2|nr:hypothetical protein [Streptomyces sp. NBC_00620]MCX4974378.1 hypothetical protein [Streptomyces sp. NBC_00620]